MTTPVWPSKEAHGPVLAEAHGTQPHSHIASTDPAIRRSITSRLLRQTEITRPNTPQPAAST